MVRVELHLTYWISACSVGNVAILSMSQNNENQRTEPLSMWGFMFGNIDDTGKLESDVFEDEVKTQLGSLSRLGLGSLLRQVTDSGNDDDSEDSDEELSE